MLQDRGPKYNLGFGMPLQEDPQQGDGTSNFIQKALDGHPVMRFFAVTAATMVGMGVAGKVVREGGLRFALKAQETAVKSGAEGKFARDGIMAFRKIEELMDNLQGLNRVFIDDPTNPYALVKKDGLRLVRDETHIADDFRMRTEQGLPWTMRDEIQQKLVAQARRLPYEAPGMYLAQKAIMDPILGNDQDPVNKVNWANPLDVIGDFSYQTMKMMGMNVLPFDIGTGALSNTYKNYAFKAMARPGNAQFAFLTTKTMLGQMGVDFGNLMDKTIKVSHQSLGAFHALIQSAAENSYGFSEFYKSRLNAAFTQAPEYANSNFAHKLFLQAKEFTNRKNTGLRKQLIDTLPAPFKGMGSGIAAAKTAFTDQGDIYDNWQSILAGRKTFDQLKKADPKAARDVQNFMIRGGGTYLDQQAITSFNLGKGLLDLPDGQSNSQFRSGLFYQTRSQHQYKAMLIDNLHRVHGLDPASAASFVRMAEHISPAAGFRSPTPGGETLIERFRFTSKKFQGALDKSKEQNTTEWWNTLVRSAGAHGIDLAGKDSMTFETFKKAVTTTDRAFNAPNFRRMMSRQIEDEWRTVHGQIMVPEAARALSTIKKPYELFSNSNLPLQKEFLLRRAASKLGVQTVDNTGNPIPLARIGEHLRTRGFDPENLKKIRGFLIDKKEIASPWSVDGENVFGFKPLNLEQAIQNQYFGAHNRDLQAEIANFVNQKTFSPITGRGGNVSSIRVNQWDLKINKVFVGRNGQVIDFGRLGRSFTSGFDKVQDDFQIPLIHLKPAQMGGWSSFKAMRNSPTVMLEPSFSTQPIALTKPTSTTGKAFELPDFYLYMKSSVKSSKGKVIGITSKIGHDIVLDQYEGLYRPFTTNVQNMLGRYGNVILGKKDIPSSQYHASDAAYAGTNITPRRKTLQRLKSLFDVSYDQENSLFIGKDSVAKRWYSALKRKPTAYTNPFLAAEKLGSPGFTAAQLTSELSTGMDSLRTTARGFGRSIHELRNLSNIPAFKNAFQVELDGTSVNMLDVPDHILPNVIRDVLKKDEFSLKGVAGADRHKLHSVQQHLNTLLNESDRQGAGFWDLQTPKSVRITGISRRIDQLRTDAFDYMLVRPEPLGLADVGAFDTTRQTLINHLEDMFNKGMISTSEKAEGRAAVLSMMLDHAANATYKPGILPIEHNKAMLDLLFEQNGAKELLAEFGAGRASHPTGFLKRGISNFFRQEPYERPNQVNPTGASHIFMPTFGTAFAKHPFKAIAGAIGLTWRDPEAMSGAQMPITHLSVRINKYFENFGMGLDETRYKSPIGFFARGIVGKRVLPLYAAGVTALTVDRTIGGMTNKDQYGNPVYSPFILGKIGTGIAAGQVVMAGLIPGGQTGREKELELQSGEVPIRKGRYWILGNTPIKGGRIQYFRPSWLQRLRSGSSYTPEMHETPLEKLMFGYDFSPLRPLDPYRREREDYSSRPYPLSGDYFTGPWGPLTGALNMSVGRLLKPRVRMHQSETKYGLGQYQGIGEFGAYFPTSPINSGGFGSAQNLSTINAGYGSSGPGTPSSGPFNAAMGYSNARGPASDMVRQTATGIGRSYSNMAGTPSPGPSYGVPTQRGEMSPRVIAGTAPLDYGTVGMTSRRIGFQSQELFGIYGFAASSLREGLGMGTKDLAPQPGVLEPASRGYSASRSFWNLNLGGLGDLPLPIEGRFSNLEISEIVRRFVPKEPAGMTYINNIPNQMGKQYPWLPGADYPLANIKAGDPYNAVLEGEIRLPGTGYARTHQLFPDQYGQLGLANIHDILGDVAPWSPEYKYADTLTKSAYMSDEARAKVAQTEAQVNAMRFKYEFTPYKYKYSSPEEMMKHPKSFAIGRAMEWITHRDTYLNTKLGAPRTATEDWERSDVYGTTFPAWEHPVSSFIDPALYKATQRNPFAAAGAGASLGFLFGSGNEAKAVGAVVGGLAETGASLFGNMYEAVMGKRFIPMDRKKQSAVEEYADIFEYIRDARASHQALIAGDQQTALMLQNQSRATMYGIDLDKSTPEKLAMAIPKRKREHFRAMLYAPQEEREQILSTAPRLERRLFEAAWGMPVEEKPDLQQYFQEHELPPPDSSIWNSGISQDTLKIKMGQSLGLDLAQMGYYPQQIQEANLLNPVYPAYNQQKNRFSIKAQLKRLLFDSGINGDVYASPSPIPGNRLQLNAGTY